MTGRKFLAMTALMGGTVLAAMPALAEGVVRVTVA